MKNRLQYYVQICTISCKLDFLIRGDYLANNSEFRIQFSEHCIVGVFPLATNFINTAGSKDVLAKLTKKPASGLMTPEAFSKSVMSCLSVI